MTKAPGPPEKRPEIDEVRGTILSPEARKAVDVVTRTLYTENNGYIHMLSRTSTKLDEEAQLAKLNFTEEGNLIIGIKEGIFMQLKDAARLEAFKLTINKVLFGAISKLGKEISAKVGDQIAEFALLLTMTGDGAAFPELEKFGYYLPKPSDFGLPNKKDWLFYIDKVKELVKDNKLKFNSPGQNGEESDSQDGQGQGQGQGKGKGQKSKGGGSGSSSSMGGDDGEEDDESQGGGYDSGEEDDSDSDSDSDDDSDNNNNKQNKGQKSSKGQKPGQDQGQNQKANQKPSQGKQISGKNIKNKEDLDKENKQGKKVIPSSTTNQADATSSDDMVRSIVNKLREGEKSRGLIPGAMASWIDALFKQPKISWVDYLRFKETGKARIVRQASRKRPTRRGDLPEYEGRIRRGGLVVYLLMDTSGSRSDLAIATIYPEMRDMHQRGATIYLLHVDAALQGVEEFTGDKDQLEVKGRGGTDLQVAFDAKEELINEHGLLPPDFWIVFTDGETGRLNITNKDGITEDVMVVLDSNGMSPENFKAQVCPECDTVCVLDIEDDRLSNI